MTEPDRGEREWRERETERERERERGEREREREKRRGGTEKGKPTSFTVSSEM